MSSSQPLVSVERRDDGVAVLRIENGKVNALSTGLLEQLEGAAQALIDSPPGAVVAACAALAGMAGVATAPDSPALGLVCGLGASAIAYAAAISAVPAARRHAIRLISLTRSRPDGDDTESKETP